MKQLFFNEFKAKRLRNIFKKYFHDEKDQKVI